METRYLDLVDFLLIAEAALGVEVAVLQRTTSLHLAESALAAPAAEFGGSEFYPEIHTKAAILCSRIVRNHPLPDGNKRLGYLCAVEFVERNGFFWQPPAEDDPGGDETVTVTQALAAGDIDEAEFAQWVAERVRMP
ncbi:MAG: Fic family protein [Actinobacteria bacterium]|nr:Fic family protein [Actinomycetota bacterium]MDQ3531736.1 Fic family protein [Actinomycetota bacterium]